MESRLEQFRRYAATCSTTDYSSPRSVKKRNAAVEQMYKLVEEAATSGETGISELVPLLDEPASALWLAHQVLEKCSISKVIERRCLEIIKTAAAGKGADALGEQMWLRDYEARCRDKSPSV